MKNKIKGGIYLILLFLTFVVFLISYSTGYQDAIPIHKEAEEFYYQKNSAEIVFNDKATNSNCVAIFASKNKPCSLITAFKELSPGFYRANFRLKAKNDKGTVNPVAEIKFLTKHENHTRLFALFPLYGSYFNTDHDWQIFDVYFRLYEPEDSVLTIIKWFDSLDLFIDYLELSKLANDKNIIYAVNLQDLNLDSKVDDFDYPMADRRILLASIQAGLNRKKPRLILLHYYDDYEGQSIYRWLFRFKIPFVLITYNECLKYLLSGASFKGCVLFNPGSPDFFAVRDPPEHQRLLFQIKAIATNLAGLKSMILTTPRTIVDIPLTRYPIKYDLTDERKYEFLTDSTGRKAFEYNLELFKTKRFNEDIIFKLFPYMSFSPYRNAAEKLTDFVIQNRYWSFYYDFRDGADTSFVHLKIFKNTHFIMGWSDEGWTEDKKYYCKEYEHIKLASKAGKLWIGDMNRIHNLSFFSKIPTRRTEFKQHKKLKVNIKPKVYISFISMDGDNPVLLLQHYCKDWDSPLRGKIPFTWGIPPKLIDLAPAILEYYYGTKTTNDYFIADVSGLGWHLTNHFDFKDFPQLPEITASYLRRLDIKVVKLMGDRNNDLTDISYMEKIIDAYPEMLGFLEGYWPPEKQGYVMIRDNYPSIRLAINRPLRDLGDTTDVSALVDAIIHTIDENKMRPLFLPVIYNIYNQNYTINTSIFEKLGMVQKILQKRNIDVEYVTLDVMMELIKQYNKRKSPN
ncbi:MAG: hypothetical protein ACUVQT_01360 [bacterium]